MCLLALVTILLSSLLATFVYYGSSDSRMKAEVRRRPNLCARRWSSLARSTWTRLPTPPTASPLIDTDGTVLFDNQADPATMENHANRQEVQRASTTGAGESTRMSGTPVRADLLLRSPAGKRPGPAGGGPNRHRLCRCVLRAALDHRRGGCSGRAHRPLLQLPDKEDCGPPSTGWTWTTPADNDVYDELSPLLGKINHQK